MIAQDVIHNQELEIQSLKYKDSLKVFKSGSTFWVKPEQRNISYYILAYLTRAYCSVFIILQWINRQIIPYSTLQNGMYHNRCIDLSIHFKTTFFQTILLT
jgi:hypothetical protein